MRAYCRTALPGCNIESRKIDFCTADSREYVRKWNPSTAVQPGDADVAYCGQSSESADVHKQPE